MKVKHAYYVSYVVEGQIDSRVVTIDNGIRSFEDVQAITAHISKQNEDKPVTVLSWKRLPGNDQIIKEDIDVEE